MTLPVFDLELTPFRSAEGWAGIDARYRAEFGPVAAGEVLLRLPAVIASVPGAVYRVEDIRVSDSAGAVPLTEVCLLYTSPSPRD